MQKGARSKTSFEFEGSVDEKDKSAPVLKQTGENILKLTSEASCDLQGGITVDISKSILRPIKDQRWTSKRENSTAYVIFIQRLLNERLGSSLVLDSQLGPKTKEAISNFQFFVQTNIGEPYASMVKEDGMIGPVTINALLSDDRNYTDLKLYLDRRQAQEIDLNDGEIPEIFQNLTSSATFDSLTFLHYFSELEPEKITELFSGVEHIMLTGEDLYLRYNLIKRMKDNMPSLKRVNFNCNYDTHEDYTTDDLGGLELCFYKSLPPKYSLGTNAKVLFQPSNLDDLLDVLSFGREFDIKYFLDSLDLKHDLTLNIDTQERLDRFIAFLDKVYFPEGGKFSLPFDFSVSSEELSSRLDSILSKRFPELHDIM